MQGRPEASPYPWPGLSSQDPGSGGTHLHAPHSAEALVPAVQEPLGPALRACVPITMQTTRRRARAPGGALTTQLTGHSNHLLGGTRPCRHCTLLARVLEGNQILQGQQAWGGALPRPPSCPEAELREGAGGQGGPLPAACGMAKVGGKPAPAYGEADIRPGAPANKHTLTSEPPPRAPLQGRCVWVRARA